MASYKQAPKITQIDSEIPTEKKPIGHMVITKDGKVWIMTTKGWEELISQISWENADW